MQKANKIKGNTVKRVAASCLTSRDDKAGNGKAGKTVSTLPFAHRTPTQLHASIYALKRP